MSNIYQLLVIEDDEDVRELLENCLSEYTLFNLKIHSFANAEDAFASCSNTKYDLVITDYKLPGVSGMEFIKQFRNLMSGEKSIPILFVSGYFSKLEACKNAEHFDDVMFLEKPFDVDKLFSRVAVLLMANEVKRS